MDLLQNLQSFTDSLPPVLQFIGVLVAALVPYVEGEGAAIIGIAAGISPWLSIPVAILGNVFIVALIVLLFERIRTAVISRRAARGRAPVSSTKRAQKVRRAFERFGVPGVSLLGPFLLPTHFTAAALVSFGVGKGYVLLWQTVAITLYAGVFGALAYAVVGAVS